MILGNRIRDCRKELKMTLQDIASEIGVAKSTIQRYENGNIENIKLPVVEAIARVLAVDPSYLLGKSETKEKSATVSDSELSELLQEPIMSDIFELLKGLNPQNLKLAQAQLEAMLNVQDKNES